LKQTPKDADKENIPLGPIIQQHTCKPMEESTNTLCSFSDFITVLIARQNVVDIEASVDVSAVKGADKLSDRKVRTKILAEKVGEAMGYFFV